MMYQYPQETPDRWRVNTKSAGQTVAAHLRVYDSGQHLPISRPTSSTNLGEGAETSYRTIFFNVDLLLNML